MQKKGTRKTGLILILLCLLLTACAEKELSGDTNSDTNTSADTEDAAEAVTYTGPVKTGDTYRDFTATLADGSTFRLSEQEGRIILLNFWATWCGPCVGEMPAFTQLTETYGDNLCLIAVNCGEKEDDVQNFLEQNGYTFPVALDPDQEISSLYPTDGIPYTVIIAPDGTITSVHLGASDAETMFSRYSAEVDKLLASE